MAEIEFDPRKNRANLEKHGIDLPTASQIWNDLVLEREDDRRDYGETRIVALGAIEGRVLVMVYTWRGDRRRLISARKANADESQIYRSTRAHLAPREED
jgi:uncharacterized protein